MRYPFSASGGSCPPKVLHLLEPFEETVSRLSAGRHRGVRHRLTAIAWISNRAPKRSVPAPMKARAGNSRVKYVR